MEDVICWIQSWRDKYCDRDWETENSFEIRTISNPGWSVDVDLAETILEGASYDSGLQDQSSEYLDDDSAMVQTKHDWYRILICEGKFRGAGDNSKLMFILQEFKRLCLEYGEDLTKTKPD